MDTLYHRLLKPVLFQFHPDTVHKIFTAIGQFSGRFKFMRWLFGLFYNYHGTDISKMVDGIMYRTPIMLAAGFDPDGLLTRILPSLSFGGEEIGSVTAHASEGNPHPHFTRLVRNKSIVVNKGLKNEGVDAVIAKLTKVRLSQNLRKSDFRNCFVLGISIARTNSPEAGQDADAGISDYVESFRKLNEAGIGDYYTINISCPNAYTGETFVEPDLLARLLPRLRAIHCDKPIYLKMPINIPWDQFSTLLAIADKNDI